MWQDLNNRSWREKETFIALRSSVSVLYICSIDWRLKIWKVINTTLSTIEMLLAFDDKDTRDNSSLSCITEAWCTNIKVSNILWVVDQINWISS